MNYHSDKWIMEKMEEHYKEALEYFPEERIVGLFYQGSGNYGLDTELSDVDTKLVVLPSFQDIVFNKPPVSTTHIRENTEHIDFKDLRLMLQTFRKQNVNFIEIIFTKYKILNPMYVEFWNKLIENREKIARYNEFAALHSMIGVANQKYFALEKEFPSKVEVLKKYGYDPKQLHHLLRIENFLNRYLEGENYEDCLLPHSLDCQELKEVKLGKYSLAEARILANGAYSRLNNIRTLAKKEEFEPPNADVDNLLNRIQYSIMERYFKYMFKRS